MTETPVVPLPLRWSRLAPRGARGPALFVLLSGKPGRGLAVLTPTGPGKGAAWMAIENADGYTLGLRAASGRLIAFLNAADRVAAGVLAGRPVPPLPARGGVSLRRLPPFVPWPSVVEDLGLEAVHAEIRSAGLEIARGTAGMRVVRRAEAHL